MRDRSSRRILKLMPKKQGPKDANETAFRILQESTGEALQDDGKDPAAVSLGRKGGLKGGKARAAKLTPEERSESAKKAAAVRWAKNQE